MEQNSAYRIVPDDCTSTEVLALLQHHLDEVHQWSPSCKVHALPAERLREPDVSFFAAWDGDTLAAVGALKELDGKRSEVKSMRAAPEYLGKGAGRAILDHILIEAGRRGYTWIGLETGRTREFDAAIALYQLHGFSECEPFGDYVSDEFSLCMEKRL